MTFEEAMERLSREIRNAQEVERTNKANGSPVESTSYDAGRYTGLKDAYELFERVEPEKVHTLPDSVIQALNEGDGTYRP